MSYASLQSKLQNGQFKKSSFNKFCSSSYLKIGKHYCIANWHRHHNNFAAHSVGCINELKCAGGSNTRACIASRRNIWYSANNGATNSEYRKGNENNERIEGSNNLENKNSNIKTWDEEKTEGESQSFFKNNEKDITLNEKSTQGEYDKMYPYTDFIIDKCKMNINSDIDTYENSWYVKLTYELLECTKILLDCSWMTSIIATTSFMRIIILPLTISSERDRRKQKILNPLIKELTNKLKTNAQSGNIKMALEFKKRILNIRNTHGISLIPKSIIFMAFFQTPLFFIFYFSMKKIAQYPDIFKEFTFESPLWLDSLALPDPYYILPLLSSLLLLSNNELTALIDKSISSNNPTKIYEEETDFQKNIKKMSKISMRLFYISSVFFFKSMPAGLFIYFITNTFLQLFITQMCKVKFVEKFLDLPPLHSKGFSYDQTEKQVNPRGKKNIHINDFIQNKAI
ncbi:mitochondrial inner membrane protein OXA1, putative [Plasmodium ovale]|uniref:Mitochondrial inner membrane protein OXA1, putative n=2 Tax=Plasmodium ovale TaxID=36330 RepID=A0A1A8VRE9_PLAOA|nr:mitochondrial inner membrane protein OXA1, putative [Plasmodium ovale curtisi]SBS92627.1 mitochondrial inner membrane protein OXA1, putative [Plasmodium ovale curtisi]SCA48529.1 mitochondrial inner membrane protein OXA1, putative [Plasmodium ovale]